VRETRVNSGRKDLHYPEPLTSLVTENGSGSSCNLSYSYVNESLGQVSGVRFRGERSNTRFICANEYVRFITYSRDCTRTVHFSVDFHRYTRLVFCANLMTKNLAQ